MWELELRTRRPGAPLLGRPLQRGRQRRDGRDPRRGRRSRGGGAATGRRGQRARRRRQHHRRRRRRAGGGGGRRRHVQGDAARARRGRGWPRRRHGGRPGGGAAPTARGRGRRRTPSRARGAGAEPRRRRRRCADATAVVPAVGLDDTLAPGSRLVFGDEPPTLAETGPRSDEFFLGTAAAVPVAALDGPGAAAPAQPGGPTSRPSKESRGARRRRLGIPRRITPRVVGFVLLVAAVPVAAYYVLRWYAYDNWIVTAQGEQIVVKQGQPGGVLWFHPKVVDHTGYTTSESSPAAIAPAQGRGPGVVAPGRQALRHQHRHHHDRPRRPPRRPPRAGRHGGASTPLPPRHHDHDDRSGHDDDRPRDHHDGCAMTGRCVPRRRRLPA